MGVVLADLATLRDLFEVDIGKKRVVEQSV
jgi:hypothetical protein